MSHVTDLKMRVRDLGALAEAAEACSMELMLGQRSHRWYGHFMNDSRDYGAHDPKDFGKCEHAIRLKGATSADYEVGVVKALDGDGFELLADTWGPGQRLLAAAGPNLNRLRQEYSVSCATRKAVATLGRRGYKVTREALPAGQVRLRLRKR